MSEPELELKFEPFSSTVDVGFWFQLTKKKLDHLRLSEEAVPIHGFYGVGCSSAFSPSRFHIGGEAFDEDYKHFAAPGLLYNTNTLESFKALNKKEFLKSLGDQIWNDIVSGNAVNTPSLLARFAMLTFADLKKYKYYYWVAFPVITPPSGQLFRLVKPAVSLSDYFSAEQVKALSDEFLAWSEKFMGFFLVKKTGPTSVATAPLSEFKTFFAENDDKIFAVATPSSSSGWPLRNFLVLLKVYFGLSKATILQLRYDRSNINDISPSDLITVDLLPDQALSKDNFGVVGWERTTDGKLAPRYLNLEQTMDPRKLAASAVDLNLKLMRWRLLPNLDLASVSKTKCLLFGAGTLGCNVARNLVAWGVREITFVDNGRVSYSNPARQWLYTFEDSKMNKPKAQTAAERLKEVFPDLNTTGVEITIPMPGHIVQGEAAVKECVEATKKIEELIKSHDVLFLLLDSREARWLPTLLGTVHKKFIITTALGFDNFVVMRHGLPADGESSSPRLGCYFCNDIVAPQDSMANRTLDQQCTVTRPGLSSIASSLSVELMVSILHHPQKAGAPADVKSEFGMETSTELGILPHQIRGYLSYFSNLIFTGHHYDKCVACSSHVVNEYLRRGTDFVVDVCNKPLLLEDLTGITKMKQESANLDVEWDDTDQDDF